MGMDQVARLALGLLPVLMFLAALRLLDSYKLVPQRKVLGALAAGAAAAAVCYAFNSLVFQQIPSRQDSYAHFGAPVVEESAKALYWIFLIYTARVAFLVDSGICGFAVGAGFALLENVFYLHALGGKSVGVWFLRGFGTAVMHGGVAALGAIITTYLSESRQWRGVWLFAPGLLAAMGLHSVFNQGMLSPAASTAVTLVGLPLILAAVFILSERSLRHWLGGKLDRDIDMLNMIASGQFQQTRQGAYLLSLHDTFPPEIRGDMLCLLQLTIELSVRAKGDLLLREFGLEVAPDPNLESEFRELDYLQKSIGPIGMLALKPLLSQSPRDLWEMHLLAQSRR